MNKRQNKKLKTKEVINIEQFVEWKGIANTLQWHWIEEDREIFNRIQKIITKYDKLSIVTKCLNEDSGG